MKVTGYAAQNAASPLAPFSFDRRDPGPRDVQIEVLYCGVCHSDLHMARNEWNMSNYPVVPGHEIAGRVTKVGSEVTRFRIGALAGVGCLVNSCRTCPECRDGLEQYCQTGFTLTYNSPDKHTGKITYGGYSNMIVVDEDFVLRLPEKLALSATGPLLCAGITTYSPLRHWKVGKGQKVGVVGLGGLGHMALKLAHAMGAHVVLFTTSPHKTADALRLGVDEVVVSKNADDLKKHARSLDFILDTVPSSHDLDTYLELLKRDATMCLVGAPPSPHPTPNVSKLIFGRRQLGGSLIGSLRETQEMLDFCAQHAIVPDVEIIPIQKINEAYERMLWRDVKYRFVIDMASLKEERQRA
jgi:alcohol dehydrogenase (NADP+)